jgi:L-rhamnose-H+ transport protein
MNALLGIIYHSIGGFAAGSFYMGYDKVKKWAWEVFWMVGGIFSWLIVPFLVAYLSIDNFLDIIFQSSSSVFYYTYLMGLLWGIGGLSYGLGIRYLGMSLGNSIMLGFCATCGAIVPPIFYYFNPIEGRKDILEMLQSQSGLFIILGVIVCAIGIAICGKAGIMKDKEQKTAQTEQKEFALIKGIIIAVISGILSSFFNFGIETGKSMAEEAVLAGCNPLLQNNVIFVVILWGGLTSNFIWTLIMSLKNKTYSQVIDTKTPILKNTFFCAIAGTTWYLQFFFYGMGESKMGNGAGSWILHMATIILTANLWGLYRKEWASVSKKTTWTIIAGIAVIFLSVVLVGIGNSIE